MIVYRICQTYPPSHNPIDGEGAAKYGGRWNSIGTLMVYTSSTLALARSELARHINLDLVPDSFRVYEIDIPEENCLEVKPLPDRWNADPEIEMTKNIGDEHFKNNKVLSIKVPSVCDEKSYNYLLNPLCDSYHLVKVVKDYPFVA